MSSRDPGPSALRLLGAILLSPLYALYGLVLIGRSILGVGRAARGARAALSATLVCPSGHHSQAVGRWRCAACGGVYHGWVGRCGVCGAGAGTMTCDQCGVTIRLPWVRR